jgi:hypothetical protein
MSWYKRFCYLCGVELAARSDDPNIKVVCLKCDPNPNIPLEPDGRDLEQP